MQLRGRLKKIFGNMTFRGRMMVGGISAVLIPFSIMAIVIYSELSASMLLIYQEKSVQITRDISAILEATLSQELKIISGVAGDYSLERALITGDYSEAEYELKEVFSRVNYDYLSFFIANSRGRIIIDFPEGQRIGLDISDRDYFIKAKNQSASVTGPVITRGPASSKWTGMPIVVSCAPIYHNRKFIGIAAFTQDMYVLGKKISGVRMGMTGYAFIIDNSGDVIIHPRKEYMMNVNLFNEPGMDKIKGMVTGRVPGIAEYNFRGTDKIAGYAPLDITGWHIFFTQDRDEIMKPVNRTLLTMLIIGTIFIIITIISIIILSGKISNPVEEMMEVMKQVTANSKELIIGIDLNKKIIFANPAAQKLFGKSENELVGTTPDFGQPHGAGSEYIWVNPEKGISWSGRIVHGNGEQVLSIIIVPIKDEKGAIQSYIVIGRDITEEMMHEKRMQQAQKMEAIGTMAGGIAHDFNNILSGIFGYSELSLAAKESPDDVEKYTRGILKAAVRARDLISQILIFSRGGEVELKPVQIRYVVKEIIKLLRASTPAIIEIESEVTSEASIMCDPTQIHQILVNLCTNAVHAIGTNPGRIKISLEDFLVDEDFAKMHPGLSSGKHVLLGVSDTGSGIEQEIIDRIFEPFFTTKSKGEGTGLGLSVVHGIVRKLNGIITVYSQNGSGTVFSIIVPTVELMADDEEDIETVLKRGDERVLFIDDEEDIAESARVILAHSGYEVTAFTDNVKALASVTDNPGAYDIIISDYSMPQMTGFDFIEKLRAAGIDIPVVVTSGYINSEIEEKAEDYGVAALLKKPFNASQVINLIRDIIDG